ncbi:MAG: hypothetical protein CML50_07160 [Rhodobacteraceae bacterium]|jgi:hypothetical protein|uniref:Uncharacterized protein n=1 Tax=Salipiger profundus TaxID=1229727 RepID=A0A1U7D423_9RHOB|nr:MULTISPECIES: hypothetical protein [Salipiger]APX22820.1 hypothetical protein Ga0080559_TMP2024 [Salipiger profundus]MAB05777.1 hypothetical protein [Paracoccaceae bacterium]GGA09412.1 hypothetical protein GCM10011326_21440 [Salipiger profundus]SFC59670.1 hypothetical protein SAMN05444415_10484 [Salipiger profundus]
MSREALAVFGACFLAGPLLFALLLRVGPSRALLLSLAPGVMATALLALALQNTGAALVSLGLMWLSWVLAVAMVALTLHRHAGHAAPRRGVTIAGLLATPLPWFGLATARMMMS